MAVTCEVAPHHLFLTEDDADRIGRSWIKVKPAIVTKEDQNALWDNMDYIDCFATDHGKDFKTFALLVHIIEFTVCTLQHHTQSRKRTLKMPLLDSQD